MRIAFALFCLLFAALSVAAGDEGVVENRVKLSSPSLAVELDPSRPVIILYRSPATDATLLGAPDRRGPEVIFYDGKDRTYRSSPGDGSRLQCSLKSAAGAASYACTLIRDGKPAAEFDLIFSLAGNRLSVTSRLLDEFGATRVISIRLPLLAVRATDQGARLALPTHSGRLVDLAKAAPLTRVHKLDSSEPIQTAIAYHSKMLGFITPSSLDDQIISQIKDYPRLGCLWIEFVRRARAEKPGLSFLIQRDSTCSVTVLEPRTDEPINWTAGAAAIRDMIPRTVNSIYSGSFIYRILLDQPGASDWTSFTDALDIVKRVGRLTASAKQVAYLVGWRQGAMDVGALGALSVNDRVGTLDQLRDLVQQASRLKAAIGLHTDLQAAYKDGPGWDESLIVRDGGGEPAKGAAGDTQAYIVSPIKCARKASERARMLLDVCPVVTVHLGSMSGDTDRIDFNPDSPAGRQKSVSAKFSIIYAFNRLGIDVTAEELSAPFAGRISHFWHVDRRPDPCWSAEDRIPLVPMIFHGRATSGNDARTDDDILDLLLCGWTANEAFTKATSDERIMDLYYLVALPWTRLAGREITGYQKKGSVERMNYGSNSYVEVDRDKGTYQVVFDGEKIASDFTTTATLSDGRTAVYSRKGGKVAIPIPASWKKTNKIRIGRLAGSESPESKVSDGKLIIDTAPQTPYWISYKEGD